MMIHLTSHRGRGNAQDPRRVPARGATNLNVPRAARDLTDTALRDAGHPLDSATRAAMESYFGHDFSAVRVHSDARGAESAAALNAVAYAVGRDIVFATGQYAPSSAAGKRLLAHELAHVVQQGATQHAAPRTSSDTAAVLKNDALERQADAQAARMVEGATPAAADAGVSPVVNGVAPANSVQREQDKDDDDPVSGPLGALGEITEWIGTATGHETLGAIGKGINVGAGIGGAAVKPDVLSIGGAAAGIADLLGVPGASQIADAIDVTSSIKEGTEATSLGDKILSGVKGTQKFGSLIAGLGGFSLEEAGGMAVSALPEAAAAGELGTAGMLGPMAAVAGAGVTGWEAGKGLDKLSNWIGHQVSSDQQADYSLSGLGATGATWLDQKATGAMRSLGLYDDTKPAYTQTLGWKLANLFD